MYNYIYHSGIVGMKWGKRNGPPYPLKDSQRSSAERKSNPPSQYNEGNSRRYLDKNTKELTDKELQDLLNRMRNERSLKVILAEETLSGKGKKAAKKVLEKTGNKAAEKLINAAVDASVNLIFKKSGIKK